MSVYLTSVAMAPDPYMSAVTVSWTGLSFTSPSTFSKQLRLLWSMSPDNVNWTALNSLSNPVIYSTSASSGSFDTTPPPEVPNGYYLRLSCFGAAHDNRIPQNWSTSSYRYYTIRKISPTPVIAPTACAVNATVAEGNVILSWSGAAAGTANPISGYEIQYSDSANGSSWGGWAALQTVSTTATSGSLSVAPPGTRGYYRRFQVRTLTANAAYNSGWKVSTNAVRRNTFPTAPTTFTASPAQYINENITLAWSGTVAGTSAIKQYVIQKSESTDNATWSAWQAVQTVPSTATSGSIVVSPTRTLGVYTLYRICVQDTLDCISSYKNSNSVYSLALPFAPIIAAPKQGAATINRSPKVLIQTQAPPGGVAQTVFVRAADGVTYNSVDHLARFTVSGATTGAVKTAFLHPATAPGSYNVTVYCRTAASGESVTRSFSVAQSSLETVMPNETRVKASHITALRTAINHAREYYSMAPYAWSHEITAKRTNIAYWPYHVQELRAAVQGILDLLRTYGDQSAAVQWISLGNGRPRADVMNQLHELLLEL